MTTDRRPVSQIRRQALEEKIRILALSKRNLHILLRSLAAVVGIDGVVGPDHASLHGFRVLSDLAVLCSFLWHRVENMVTRRERRPSSPRRLPNETCSKSTRTRIFFYSDHSGLSISSKKALLNNDTDLSENSPALLVGKKMISRSHHAQGLQGRDADRESQSGEQRRCRPIAPSPVKKPRRRARDVPRTHSRLVCVRICHARTP